MGGGYDQRVSYFRLDGVFAHMVVPRNSKGVGLAPVGLVPEGRVLAYEVAGQALAPEGRARHQLREYWLFDEANVTSRQIATGVSRPFVTVAVPGARFTIPQPFGDGDEFAPANGHSWRYSSSGRYLEALSTEGAVLRRVLLPRDASRLTEAMFRSFLRDSLVWIHREQRSLVESLAEQIPSPEFEPTLRSLRASSNGAVVILDSGTGQYWLARGDRFEEVLPPPGFGLADVLGDTLLLGATGSESTTTLLRCTMGSSESGRTP